MLRKYMLAVLLTLGLCGGLVLATPPQRRRGRPQPAESQRDKCFRRCRNAYEREKQACKGNAACERVADVRFNSCNDYCGRKFGAASRRDDYSQSCQSVSEGGGGSVSGKAAAREAGM